MKKISPEFVKAYQSLHHHHSTWSPLLGGISPHYSVLTWPLTNYHYHSYLWHPRWPQSLCGLSLPPDVPSTEQQELFTQKLQQCCMLFDFMDSVIDLKSKEIKRATLNELVEYVSTNRGVLVETSYPEITSMVSTLMCDVMSYLSGCHTMSSQRFNFFVWLMSTHVTHVSVKGISSQV